MSNLIGWMKSNIAIVALTAVIIIALPLGFVGSSMWNNRIRTAREEEARKAMMDLDQARISYVIPSALPGEENVTLNLEGPNARATEFFREHRKRLEEQIGRIVSVAEEINSEGHKPLVQGVFPKPTDGLKTLEMAEVLVGKGERPSTYKKLLETINAGRPASAVKLQQALEQYRIEAVERVRASSNRNELTPEEQRTLVQELAAQRLGSYQQRAREISVYASESVFPRTLPTAIPPQPPAVDECFQWQADLWLVEDLLRAVDRANTADSQRTTVDRSVVKRIEEITLDPLLPRQGVSDPYGSGGGDGELAGGPRNPITGRSGGPANPLYDVRNATLRVVVDSARLPQLINAISRTNFMTVIDLDFEEADVWNDLEQGYFYGNDHVVRATLRIETIWLRSWTTQYMPPRIRLAMTGSEGTEDQGDMDPGSGG